MEVNGLVVVKMAHKEEGYLFNEKNFLFIFVVLLSVYLISAGFNGHNDSEIVVRLNDQDYALKDAIQSGDLFVYSNPGTSPSSPFYGHTGDEYYIDSLGKSLQKAIDDGDFLPEGVCDERAAGEIFTENQSCVASSYSCNCIPTRCTPCHIYSCHYEPYGGRCDWGGDAPCPCAYSCQTCYTYGEQTREVICAEGNIEPILDGGEWSTCA